MLDCGTSSKHVLFSITSTMIGFRFQYGQDIGAATFCYLSWALWHLGHVKKAAKVADQAIQRAEALSHPHTLVYTLCHARPFIDVFKRQWEEIQSYAPVIVSLCAEHGLSHWMNCGRIFEGWAAVCGGDVHDGGRGLLQSRS
jgi:hypothetical protein